MIIITIIYNYMRSVDRNYYCYVTADSNVRPETVGLSFGKVGTVNDYIYTSHGNGDLAYLLMMGGCVGQ